MFLLHSFSYSSQLFRVPLQRRNLFLNFLGCSINAKLEHVIGHLRKYMGGFALRACGIIDIRCRYHRYQVSVSVSSISDIGITDIRYRYRYHRYQVSVSSISGIGIIDNRYWYHRYHISVSAISDSGISDIRHRYRYQRYQVSVSLSCRYLISSSSVSHGDLTGISSVSHQ